MKGRILLVAFSLVAALGVGGTASVGGSATVSASARFSARVDNPWFPLRPGTRYVYSGAKDGRAARDVVTVTHETVTIAGAQCRLVRDLLYLDGRLAERTSDWYTQDRSGAVWYFGEQTAELDRHGRVTSTEGSWRAGVDGAKPGIFMPAQPRVGEGYRQEFYKGQAEDRFRVVGIFGGATRPIVRNGLLTEEWTPLEPGVLDHKLYVRGVGNVVERSVRGGNEHLELQQMRSGS